MTNIFIWFNSAIGWIFFDSASLDWWFSHLIYLRYLAVQSFSWSIRACGALTKQVHRFTFLKDLCKVSVSLFGTKAPVTFYFSSFEIDRSRSKVNWHALTLPGTVFEILKVEVAVFVISWQMILWNFVEGCKSYFIVNFPSYRKSERVGLYFCKLTIL